MQTKEGTLLVIGGSGELGSSVVSASISRWGGLIIATYHSRGPSITQQRLKGVRWKRLDCSSHDAVRSFLAHEDGICSIVYCAVPKHGGASGEGGNIIRQGIVDDVVNCAESAAMIGARFIAISTDLVFDGMVEEGHLYSEKDAVCPMSAYGVYKAEMERELRRISGNIVIARTSLILSIYEEDGNGDEFSCMRFGKGFQFVADALRGKFGDIEIFTDELRNMSFSDDLGAALVELASFGCKYMGILHLASEEVTNRWDLVKFLARKLDLDSLLGVHAKPGLYRLSGLKRPLKCALNTAVAQNQLKTHIRGMAERLG